MLKDNLASVFASPAFFCAAAGLNPFTEKYIRAECENATLILSRRKIERFDYNPDKAGDTRAEGDGEKVPLLQQDKWANAWLIEKFVNWLDGGDKLETNVEDSLQSMEIVFAAIKSARTGQPIKVQEYIASVKSKVLKG